LSRSEWTQTSTGVNVLWHDGGVTATAQPSTPPAAVCCSPLLREPLSAEDAHVLARTVKALADPTRLRLVSLVAAHGGEACVCDLTEPVGLSQPTVSHHLKVLVDAGLMAREKRGVWAYYSLVPGSLDALARVLATEGC
jgi:ArsR family transcriptional regulator